MQVIEKTRSAWANAKVAAVVALAGAAASAQAQTDPTAALFGAVDLSGVASGVGALGIAVVGIALALKGISLVKRAISKA